MNDTEQAQVDSQLSKYVVVESMSNTPFGRPMSSVERNHFQYHGFRALIPADALPYIERVNAMIGENIVRATVCIEYLDGVEMYCYQVLWYESWRTMSAAAWKSINTRVRRIEDARREVSNMAWRANNR